jgi:hypothetical protein
MYQRSSNRHFARNDGVGEVSKEGHFRGTIDEIYRIRALQKKSMIKTEQKEIDQKKRWT